MRQQQSARHHHHGADAQPSEHPGAARRIVIVINESYIYNIFKNLEYTDERDTDGGGNVFLLDSDGIIVSNKDKSLLGTPVAEEINEVVNSRDNNFYLKQIDGVDYYVYGSSTLSNGWKIAVTVTASYYMQDIQTLRSAFFLVVIIIAFLAAGIAVPGQQDHHQSAGAALPIDGAVRAGGFRGQLHR